MSRSTKPSDPVDDQPIPLSFHKIKVKEALSGGFCLGGVCGVLGCVAFFVGINVLYGIIDTYEGGHEALYGTPPDKEEVIFSGVLTENGTVSRFPHLKRLKFENYDWVTVTTNKAVPYYVGEYQELVCERDKDGQLKLVRNYCPAQTFPKGLSHE